MHTNVWPAVSCKFFLGNPWPPVVPKQRDRSGNLINVLLQSAATEFYQQKANNSFSESSELWAAKNSRQTSVSAKSAKCESSNKPATAGNNSLSNVNLDSSQK